MSIPDKNFTFRMPNDLREALTVVGEIEDRSLSKVAEYFLWAGFEKYIKEKRLLSAYEVKTLSQTYLSTLLEAGLADVQSEMTQTPLEDGGLDIGITLKGVPKSKKEVELASQVPMSHGDGKHHEKLSRKARQDIEDARQMNKEAVARKKAQRKAEESG